MALLTLRGPEGARVSLRFDGSRLRIGRARANDLVLHDPALSRFHLELRRDERGWSAVDLGSRNGSLLNGRALVGSEPVRAGDEVMAGGVALVLEDEDDSAGEGADQVAEDRVARAATAEEDALVGGSAALLEVKDAIDRVAASNASVLITGESGTGKELVAHALHRRSDRRDRAFVVVNCPTLRGSLLEAELFGIEAGVATGVSARPGRLEKAHGGTLFLDEVGDLDAPAQAMLLRFLQERTLERLGGREPMRVDVRVIAATNRDLRAAVADGSFRRDLYHRLDVVSLELPALRDRREDVPALVEHFLRRDGGGRVQVSPEAMDALRAHAWPGNVRELEHAVESARLMAQGPWIRLRDLPASVRRPQAPGSAGAAVSAAAGTEERARALLDQIVAGGSFWTLVREPYLARVLPREVVQALVRQAHDRSGSYKGVAQLFGIPRQHKKLLNFLWSQGLRVGEE